MMKMKSWAAAISMVGMVGIMQAKGAEGTAPDLTTPKGTVKLCATLLVHGKLDEAKACFVTPANDEERALLENGVSDGTFNFILFAAMKEKFPDEVGKAFPHTDKMIAQMNGMFDGITETVEGNTATLAPASAGGRGLAPQPLKLVKEGESWKIAVTEGSFLYKAPAQVAAQNVAMKAAYLELAAAIRAGKFATAVEAGEAVDTRRREVQAKFQGAATQPTTSPR